jgi:cell division protein FtsI (penicillin-binding protein 3)
MEPGSTVKPWVILAALESGKFKPNDIIDTNPGYLMVAGKSIRDHRNYGAMDLSMAIAKSSNIAMAKIAFALDVNTVRDMFVRLGAGQAVGTNFPGEGTGFVPILKPLQKIERANVSYGYALTMTPLQIAQAYSVIASGGIKRPVSLLKVDSIPEGQRVIEKENAEHVIGMLKRVVAAEGTGSRAKTLSYSVAGKTGTSYKAINGKYSTKQMASFIGMAPTVNPRIVALVVIDDPKGEGIQANGGWVAAPVFSKVAEDALRMLQIPPDTIVTKDDASLASKSGSPPKPLVTRSEG